MRVVDLRIAKELSEGGVLLKGTAKYGGSAHSHSIHTSNQKSSEIMRGGKKSPPPFPEVREKWGTHPRPWTLRFVAIRYREVRFTEEYATGVRKSEMR